MDPKDQVKDSFDPTPSVNHGQRILYTGPDGIIDQTMHIEPEHRYIGIGTMSAEGTSELNYLYRPGPEENLATSTSFQRKHETIGGIGWGHQDAAFLNRKLSDDKNHKCIRGVFRQAAEDRFTHLYQSPYYDPQESEAKSKKVK